MTFATAASCACDECDININDVIPPEILRAVRAHQNKRKSDQLIAPFDKRSKVNIVQRRELIERFGGVSLWKLTMPAGNGDPIVEYRNSHRIVFVQRLPRVNSTVFSIGRGIIGSAAEEKDRKPVRWGQGSAHYLPCRKGLACGWIHKQPRDGDDNQNESVEECDTVDTDVTLYIFKASTEAIHEDIHSRDVPAWVQCLTEQFIRCMGSDESKVYDNNVETNRVEDKNTDGDASEGILLSENDSIMISGIIEQIVCYRSPSTNHST
jgi:hypothetical protein